VIDCKSGQEENKMGIDKETQPKWVNLVVDNNPAYHKDLKAQAEEDGQNVDGANKLSITMDKHSYEPSEFYLEDDGTLIIDGNLKSATGETYVGVNIPLSDTVLVDVLNYAIKKLNKLKTALETLS